MSSEEKEARNMFYDELKETETWLLNRISHTFNSYAYMAIIELNRINVKLKRMDG